MTSGAMPAPVSATAISTYCPASIAYSCGVGVIHESVQGLDGEPAAARHGVARVDREIEDRVLKLRRIGLDLPQTGGQHGLDFDLLAKRPVEQSRSCRRPAC